MGLGSVVGLFSVGTGACALKERRELVVATVGWEPRGRDGVESAVEGDCFGYGGAAVA